MLPDILIGLGIIGIVIGSIGLLRRYVKPIVNSPQILIGFLVIGLLLPLGLVIKYVSRGNDALSSIDIRGITKGNDSMEYQQDQVNSMINQYMDANGNSYLYHVSISQNTIYFNGQMIGGVEEFEEYLHKLDRRLDVFLEDDFAVSATYYKVEELLNNFGLTIIRKG